MHTESNLSPNNVRQAFTVFADWVGSLLIRDKFDIFMNLIRFPLPTPSLVSVIYSEQEKVYDGRNPTYNYSFTDSEILADWETYRIEVLKDPVKWRKDSWSAVKTAINSVLVIDVPEQQTTERPEPYSYFLDISKVKDYEFIGEALAWIMFETCVGEVAILDGETYRLVKVNDTNQITDVVVETAHGLGYCPAMFFWSEELTKSDNGVKKSLISTQLANLDWLLFFATGKKHLDTYAPYPIISTYEKECDYDNNHEHCGGGYLRDINDNYVIDANGTPAKCPVCSVRRFAGAGSVVEVPIPDDGGHDLRNPVNITSIDRPSLDYNVEEVERLSAEIVSNVVGFGGDVQRKQSLNEMQISASFESRTAVLNSIKANLEAAQKFKDDTICRLRYGANFLGSSISMGTEFYLYSLDDLYAQYKQAKENGASETVLDAINKQIASTEYRNNPQELARINVLRHLEPFRHYTLAELLALSAAGAIDAELLKIKTHFVDYVERFERENIDIVAFGSQLEFGKKIDIINSKFKDYAREEKTLRPAETRDSESERVNESESFGSGQGSGESQ